MPEKHSTNCTSEQPSSQAGRGMGRFVRFSLIYAVGDLLTKGARIVLIPFYLSMLTQAEVGQLAVLQTLVVFSTTVLGFGFGFVLRRFYHDRKDQGDVLASTLWASRFVYGLPIYGLLLLLALSLKQWSGSSIAIGTIQLALTIGFLKGGQNIIESWLNIREEPVKYRAFTFSQFSTTTLLIVYFLAVNEQGVYGAILGELVSQVIFTILSAVLLFRRSLPQFKEVQWKQVFSYCLPVLPHSLFMWGLLGADRLILNEHVASEDIAIYDVGYMVASFLSIVVLSMRAAWIPSYFQNASTLDGIRQFRQVSSIFLFITAYAALMGLLFAPEAIYLFSLPSASSYVGSVGIMRAIIFAYVAMAMFMAANQPLLYARRTGLLAAISGTGFIINVGINLILIPEFGTSAAAAATIVSYVCMALLTPLLASSTNERQWDSVPTILTLSSFLALGTIACLFPPQPHQADTPAKLLVALVFPALTLIRIDRSPTDTLCLKARFEWANLRSIGRRTAS